MADDIHILHVDDDPDFAAVTAEALQRNDSRFTVETATSGVEGLDRITPAVDCVVSDYDMPGMDGLEFLEAIREEHPALPFILFTGHGSEEVASEALTLGATDYLQKASGTDQYSLLANRITRSVEQFQAEQELQRQNERLSEFVTVVSHDMRNLLRTLSASLDFLEMSDTDDLERCARTVNRMEQLIDDLVRLAEYGETELDPAPVTITDLAEPSAQTAGLPKRALSVVTDATIVADEGRLRHIFENLFANAITHGGQDVSITVGRLDDGFYIEDDGVGIPDAERERVFRVGYSTSTEGTGFGLNIVKQVAEAHGWAVRVTDSDDGGARFEFTGVEFTDG